MSQSTKLLAACALTSLMLFPATSVAGQLRVLVTKSYVVTVTDRCKHGTLDCKSVEYYEVNRENGRSRLIRGSSWFRSCAGTRDVCEWYGYFFKRGETTIFVSRDGELTINENQDSVEEVGKWVTEMGVIDEHP